MARLPHNIEPRLIGDRAAFPYRGWTGRRGTLYWIYRADGGKGWNAMPSPRAVHHADEPSRLYAPSLRALGERLEEV